MNGEKILGVPIEEVERHQQRKAEIAGASATPLPGPALDGIDPQPLKVCGFTVRPMEMEDVIFLQRIDSPLVRMGEISAELNVSNGNGQSLPEMLFAKLVSPKEGETNRDAEARLFEGLIESFFIFVKSPKIIRKLIRQGREAFNDAAMDEVGNNLKPGDLDKVAEALIANFAQGYSTVVGYQAKKEEGEGSFLVPQPRIATA